MKKRNNKNPFKTPEGYFENLADRLKERLMDEDIQVLDGFKEFPDKLDVISDGDIEHFTNEHGLPSSNGFTVPDRYFDELHQNLKQKLDGAYLDGEKTKVVAIRPFKKYYYAVASIAAILIVAFTLNLYIAEETLTESEITGYVGFEDIGSTEIENYFDDENLDLSAYEMAELLPFDALEINDIVSYKMDDAPILQYVDDNTELYDDLNYTYDE